ncbi:NUC189-domain-containing protein [Obba rivulosa]|uniref:NUC189-domain-containing protein n=1 Tax=Obba rivulosa TaxID=1052685 RepID=A0A8E2B4Z6_9APHY|nr:NUC189-domain-containing protein [Obba rivulosa]
MASTPSKSKKSRTKPPRGRPQATSAISQPAVEDSSSLTYLSAFSPLGDLFAFLSLAIDKHRLRIYDTATGQSIAEHVVDAARVSSLAWARMDLSDGSKKAENEDTTHQPKRKRKKRDSLAPQSSTPGLTPQIVLLGLSDGSISLFSPSHGRVVRTLSHPSSTTAILSVAVDETARATSVWTSSADGTIRHWDATKNDILDAWSADDRLAYSALSVRPSTTEKEGRADVLAAHHSIHLLSMSSSATGVNNSEVKKPKELSRFTGHASLVKDLRWSSSSRFLSMAEADRFVYVWDVSEAASSEGKIAASIPLDSDARSISLSTPSSSQQSILLTLSAGNKISIFPLPTEGTVPSPSKSKQKIATLEPTSTVSISSKKDVEPVKVVAASFIAGEEGRIRVARLVGGIQPVFEVVQYLDASGDFIQDITISHDVSKLLSNAADSAIGAPSQRYNESSSLAVRSGVELGQDPALDDLDLRDIDGNLDVDLAELSLGQRLTAITGADGSARPASDDEDDTARVTRSGASKAEEAPTTVPASSLTRTLIQALHSSDARLLEMCLAHSDAALIRNTVRRLPPQLAVPLIMACVERLGRGARAANMKGGGGGASSQRGAALIRWIKIALAAHSGHLLTMPDLVARLSGLHATLTTRMALQESLLSLSGRLDMVVAQIEMRSSGAPAPLPLPKSSRKKRGKGKQAGVREPRRYVEGESELEEEEQMEVEVESGDDEGSVEDVELGGSDDEEEGPGGEDEDEDDEDEDEEDEDDEEDGPGLNGFIDDEAEEYSEDEDEDESE